MAYIKKPNSQQPLRTPNSQPSNHPKHQTHNLATTQNTGPRSL